MDRRRVEAFVNYNYQPLSFKKLCENSLLLWFPVLVLAFVAKATDKGFWPVFYAISSTFTIVLLLGATVFYNMAACFYSRYWLAIYGLAVFCFGIERGNRRPGEEHGSAKWGNPKAVNTRYTSHKQPMIVREHAEKNSLML